MIRVEYKNAVTGCRNNIFQGHFIDSGILSPLGGQLGSLFENNGVMYQGITSSLKVTMYPIKIRRFNLSDIYNKSDLLYRSYIKTKLK